MISDNLEQMPARDLKTGSIEQYSRVKVGCLLDVRRHTIEKTMLTGTAVIRNRTSGGVRGGGRKPSTYSIASTVVNAH